MRNFFIKTVAASLAVLASADAWAAIVPPALVSKRKFTIVKVEIAKPTGDPVAAGSADNEFTFMGAAGVATIPVQATVTPTANAATIGSSIKWTFVSIPPGTVLTWNNPWPGDSTAGQGVNAVATLTGYPASNSDFGPRTVKMEVIQGTKVLATKTALIELFFERDMPATGRTAPNWFFYWNQTAAGELIAIYVPALGDFGQTPAGKFWSTYAGPRRRTYISDGSQLADTRRDGTGLAVTGIDLFTNVIAHENRHVQQIFENNAQPFYNGVTGALRDAASAGYSFLIAKSTLTVWNHFTDNDSNGHLSPGDADLDTDGDDIANTLEPTAAQRAACGTPSDIECQANLDETIPNDTYLTIDWADPGKQHRTSSHSD